MEEMDCLTWENEKYPKRWLVYFDLLGTKKLIQEDCLPNIMDVFEKAVKSAKRSTQPLMPSSPKIWTSQKKIKQEDSFTYEDVTALSFSDTFIFYAPKSTAATSAFSVMSHIAWWFFRDCIKNRIAVRGSISYGQFYSDKEKKIFFGKSLVEAHEYGEAQNWLGLVLCPSVVRNVKATKKSDEKQKNFEYVLNKCWPLTNIERKKECPLEKNLHAYNLKDIQGTLDGESWRGSYIRDIGIMMSKAEEDYREKYKNTLNFLNN